MNHPITLALLAFMGYLSPAAAGAQEASSKKAPHQEHYLDFDHDTGKGMTLGTAPLRLDDNIRVRITNVNRLMYQVTVTGNNEVFESEPPPGFMTLLGFQVAKEAEASEAADNVNSTTPAPPNAKASELNTSEEKLRKLTEQLERNQLVERGLKELSARFQNFTDGADLTTTKAFLSTQAVEAGKVLQVDSVANAREIARLKAHITGLRDSIQKGQEDQGRYDQALKDLKTRFKQFGKAFEALERMKSLYNKLAGIAYHEGFDLAETGKLLAEVIKDMPYVNDKDGLVREYEGEQIAMDEALEEFRDIALRLNKKKDETERLIKPIVDRFTKLKAAQAAYDYAKLFKDIDELYWTLQDPSMFTIVSDPVPAKADVVNFKVEINGRSGVSSLAALRNRSFEHPEFIRGGVRVEWSTGIMFQAGLSDASFRLEPNAEDATRVTLMANEQRQQFKPALGALMHVAPRVENHFRFAGIIGAGLNDTDLEKATFYAGLGLGFGRKEKVYLNLGVAGKKVDVLSGAYTEGQDLPAEGSADLTLTSGAFRIGGFIGVTMTLNKQDKEKPVKKQ